MNDEHYCDRIDCDRRPYERFHWCSEHQPHAIRRPTLLGRMYDAGSVIPVRKDATVWTYREATYREATVRELLASYQEGRISLRSLMDVFGVGITR